MPRREGARARGPKAALARGPGTGPIGGGGRGRGARARGVPRGLVLLGPFWLPSADFEHGFPICGTLRTADTWHARQSLYEATYGLIFKSHSVRAPRPSLRLSLVLHNGAARVTKGAPHHHLEAVEAIPETSVMKSSEGHQLHARAGPVAGCVGAGRLSHRSRR